MVEDGKPDPDYAGHYNHSWVGSLREARAIQERLSKAVITEDAFGAIQTVAGVDVGFEGHKAIAQAAVALLPYKLWPG